MAATPETITAGQDVLLWAPYLPGAARARAPLQAATLRGARVAVVGLGVSGRAMASLLHGLGAELTLVDARTEVAEEVRAAYPGARFCLGPTAPGALAACAYVALSPGVDPRQPAIARALDGGAFVFGELELLALRAQPACTAAITGTNGKSTTTALCGALMHALATPAFVGGNLGEPMAGWLSAGAHEPAAVLELSSYQIDGAWNYAPDVAAVLNLAPDHLARYGDVATYARSKARLLGQLAAGGIAVLNADDATVRAMAPLVRGTVLWFGTSGAPLPGPGLTWDSVEDVARPVQAGDAPLDLAPLALALRHDTLLGAHNRTNALAALLLACALQRAVELRGNAPVAAGAGRQRRLAAGYAAFGGLPHRLAPLGEVAGVRYVDDSKATNDASVATAVRAMPGAFLLLLGGLDDGAPLPELLASLASRPPRAVVTFGAAGPRLHRLLSAAAAAGGFSLQAAGPLPEACAQAAALARPGDTVLLSPGCKSFDAFADYRARGRAFAAWVAARPRLAPSAQR